MAAICGFADFELGTSREVAGQRMMTGVRGATQPITPRSRPGVDWDGGAPAVWVAHDAVAP